MEGYTIGQLAKAARVPTSTVRYYERAGLLKPEFRTGGNYRGYSDRALERLRFIRSAQATGFSLADIIELLSLTSSEDSPCDDVVSLLGRRLADVRERIRELRDIERVLAKSLKGCCAGNEPDLCDEIVKLRGKPSGQTSTKRKLPTLA